ncbi:MAG: threonine synthase [Solirubrobacteraceae bacterium]|jgi:threonine synthase|nr:threonine synthase [Solirubrobacteraceae bacterium]MEA2226293.1 threonine synthase [Solirubrobacteraceae bacterium]MEA2335041.1 threonine synthase [Solirubrobacteraceae bacterium]
MSPQTVESPAQGSRQRTRSCATELVCHRCENSYPLESTVFSCPDCGKGLDIVYDYELAASHFRDFPTSERPQNIWHFEELLPIVDAAAQARVGQHSGYTPLIRAERLGAELGIANLYLKDDSSNRPSLSYKDRVVSMSVARLLERGKTEIGCVSTGNVGTAVASFAAKAGVDAFVFYPNRLEEMKARVCMALGAKVVQVQGNYDEANRRCREVAEATGMDFANITLRPFYAEGAKTAAFEIVEQFDWEAPDHIVSPAAGGTLSSRMHKGLIELQLLGLSETERTRIHIAQPSGCNPIASAILAEEAEVHPVMPETAAHSLAIGAPGDGYLVIDAVHKRGGTAAFASDPEIFAGIDLLAATEGLLTEPAGGTTIAVLEKLAAAGRFAAGDTVVALITGNGLKTLDEHPQKPWPAKIDCELDAMLAALGELKSTETLLQSARVQLAQ